ncbi:MAG: stage V sporulation protein AD [Oscillospiraceae bacterium]|nr:stage V sporulation protein AD [Oscillospiraceae bacterium]MDD7355110.1 stage V sporulation protein AD [Oscillospiraceae bacterium]MDY3937765.1 stage V sporulation protein AD [Oscillospiraceae bacterium]
MNRIGKYTVRTDGVFVSSAAAAVGKTEHDGPMGEYFDFSYPDDGIGQTSWEQAESELHRKAVETAIKKANLMPDEINIHFGGDLLNQCCATTFGVKDFNIPIAGLFGACSTMALALALSAVLVSSGYADNALASASSHFCSAEKQFRFPLEYGGQRPPTAQRTATAAGAGIISNSDNGSSVKIQSAIFGRICDPDITDANNMGAAMAPAAADTIARFLNDTNTMPEDYDIILTGDLGAIGSELLIDILAENYNIDISKVHNDCGLMLFDKEKQDVYSGGSGCGCSASVVCSYIFKKLSSGELKKVFFAGTGALMSPTTSQQSLSIPSIAHGVLLTGKGV